MVQLALVDTVNYNPNTMTGIQAAEQLMENVEAGLENNNYRLVGFSTPDVNLAVIGINL